MTAMSNIIAYDGADTPVEHTFIGLSVVRKGNAIVASYRENLAAVPVDAQATITLSLEQLKSGIYKSTSRIVVPVMESVSGQNAAGYTAAPKVAFEDTYITQGFFHPRSTKASRKIVAVLGINMTRNTVASASYPDVGPFAELFYFLQTPS